MSEQNRPQKAKEGPALSPHSAPRSYNTIVVQSAQEHKAAK